MKNRHGRAYGPCLLRDLQTLRYRRLDLRRALDRLCLSLACHLRGLSCALHRLSLNRTLHRLSCTLNLLCRILGHLLPLNHGLALALRHGLSCIYGLTLACHLSGLCRTLHRHRLCGALHLLYRALHRLSLTLGHLGPLRCRLLDRTLHCTCRSLLIHGSSYIFGSGHTLRRRLISGETGRLRTLTLKGSLMLYSPYDCSIS